METAALTIALAILAAAFVWRIWMSCRMTPTQKYYRDEEIRRKHGARYLPENDPLNRL